ncbi:MAG TPA: carboxypeptidase-like regulatory domain-containing protein [Gemmatimonadaceae bacterium]|nr:carboxypeptidase-like regulatory domain-containing protein [Gemmatimonadaceae bacterium]
MPAVPSVVRRSIVPLAIVLAAVAGCHTFPNEPDATRWDPPPSLDPIGNFTGTVRDFNSNVLVPGATVWIGDVVSVSDANGFYNVAGVRGNQVLIQAWKEGYDTLRVSHQILGPNITYNVRLRPQQ